MIKKFNGHLALPSGKLIECQGEIDIEPAPIDDELLEKTQHFNDAIKKLRTPTQIIVSFDGSYVPTGPVVDSTLAEKDEGEQ
jgi:hypothetical protein